MRGGGVGSILWVVKERANKLHLYFDPTNPAGVCQNDVISTSMRRHHVASTLIRRHFYVVRTGNKQTSESLYRHQLTSSLGINVYV